MSKPFVVHASAQGEQLEMAQAGDLLEVLVGPFRAVLHPDGCDHALGLRDFSTLAFEQFADLGVIGATESGRQCEDRDREEKPVVQSERITRLSWLALMVNRIHTLLPVPERLQCCTYIHSMVCHDFEIVHCAFSTTLV